MAFAIAEHCPGLKNTGINAGTVEPNSNSFCPAGRSTVYADATGLICIGCGQYEPNGFDSRIVTTQQLLTGTENLKKLRG